MVATNSNFASTIIPKRAHQPSESMANLVSTMRHNVFCGLGEDLDVHINRFNTMAQANNQATDADKLRVFANKPTPCVGDKRLGYLY